MAKLLEFYISKDQLSTQNLKLKLVIKDHFINKIRINLCKNLRDISPN
jgi:hypothetical protein